MAIPEYTSKTFTFKTTPEMSEHLESIANKSEYIRRAIADKIQRDKTKREVK